MPSRARWLRIRSTHARSSSAERTLPSESIGSRCVTFSRRPTGSPPTRWVGESGGRERGVVALDRPQLVEQPVVGVVADLRVVEDVVAVGVVFELLAQLRGACCDLLRRRRRAAPRRSAARRAHDAASGAGRSPIGGSSRPSRSKRRSASRLARSVRSKWIGVTAIRPAATAARSVPGSSWKPGSEP